MKNVSISPGVLDFLEKYEWGYPFDGIMDMATEGYEDEDDEEDADVIQAEE